ncbi:MAG TPA: serine/threonine-protein kinase, partial [Labilithrix sp.]|nr:serine/threonine-protein kinase [Labilithrix sp.]
MSSAAENASVALHQPSAGTILGGKYRIDLLLAEGGMSYVYAAHDSSLDERVAIKLLKQEFRKQKDVLARFVREAKTIRRIHSDHCVKVLEVGMDPDHGPFMVMEFLAGKNLRDILESGGKLVTRRACELVVQVCDALAAAHTNDCIHRDIKPDNIVVLTRGDLEDVRVLDFGISKHSLTGSVLNQDLSLVNTLNLMGTPMYMSPEQMRSTSGADCRTDIWSVGAMFYEMLTGRPPFVSDSITELCSMVIEDEPAPISQLEPTVPEELCRIVHKCLQKKPADRYQNVGELALALLPHTPRRARACVERIVSTLTAAGVAIDLSEVSKYPPPNSNTPPVVIPPAAALPSSLQPPRTSGIELARTLDRVSISSGLAVTAGTPTLPAPPGAAQSPVFVDSRVVPAQQKRGIFLWLVVPGLVSFVLAVAVSAWLSRRATAETPTGTAPLVAETALPAPVTAQAPTTADDA